MFARASGIWLRLSGQLRWAAPRLEGDPDSPAFDVVQRATCAEYADVAALEQFAAEVDVVTYEFENVPSATALILAARRPVHRWSHRLVSRTRAGPSGAARSARP